MDPRLLRHYNLELQHLREMGAEFARQFPKIAARLGMQGIEVVDPYVERLLEGSAFLAARVQLKLDEEFPRFTQRLLQIVYPHLLAPTPAMLVAQLQPDPSDPNLAAGITLPRHAALTSQRGGSGYTACVFRTAADLTLWPLTVHEARYLTHVPDLSLAGLPYARQVKGVLRLRLKVTAGLDASHLRLDTLRVFFAGMDDMAYALHELVTGHTLGVLVCSVSRPLTHVATLPAQAVQMAGFDGDEALLPTTLRSFGGYRLLHEYFAFPQRYLFADVSGLSGVLPAMTGDEVEINLLLDRGDPALAHQVSADNVLLHCVPAINLFPKRAGRTLVSEGVFEFHVVPDRSRPLDFEVYSVEDVRGYAAGNDGEQVFHPFYAAFHTEAPGQHAFYTVQREPRLLSESRKRQGNRSDYVGSEVFVAVVDPSEAPFRRDLRQLAFDTLCTNRDLPLLMPLGGERSDFTLDGAAPVAAIRCVKGPSRPYGASLASGTHWKLVNQLSLNYLSLLDSSPQEGAAALRALLALHAPEGQAAATNLVNGLLSVSSRQTVRRLPMVGPIAFGRGLEVSVLLDELAYQGHSAYLLGCVLERFLARYVSINTFVQTVVSTNTRGEIVRRSPRCGTRPIF